MKAIQTSLVNEFKNNHNDKDFPARAYQQIADFKGKIGDSNKNDPNRLNVRSIYLNQLKMKCIASLAHHEVDSHYDTDMNEIWNAHTEEDRKKIDKFEKMTILDAYKQQRIWRREQPRGVESALEKVRVIPQILEEVKMTKAEFQLLDKNRQARMLERPEIKADADAMIAAVLPDLHSQSIPRLALALLLLTGRRSTEIFKTAVFKKVKEYRVLFSGQTKTMDDAPFEIDLLAPADLIIKALATLRGLADTTQMSNIETHTKYGKMMTREVDKLHKQLGLTKEQKLTPHTLRTIYGGACIMLYKPEKKKEIAYLAELLGHASTQSTGHYRYVDVEITLPAVETKETKEETKGEAKGESKRDPIVKDELFGLTGSGSIPHNNRIASIAKLMKARKVYLTQTSILLASGGSRPVIKDVMKWGNNKAIIDAYNDSL